MNRKPKLAIAVAVIFGSIGLLIAGGLSSNTGSYLTIPEALAVQSSSADKFIQMEGTLVKGSEAWDPDAITLKFDLTDGEKRINITYNGVKPDNFNSGYPIIVEGRFDDASRFMAENLKVKCPSKYESEPKKQPAPDAVKLQQ